MQCFLEGAEPWLRKLFPPSSPALLKLFYSLLCKRLCTNQSCSWSFPLLDPFTDSSFVAVGGSTKAEPYLVHQCWPTYSYPPQYSECIWFFYHSKNILKVCSFYASFSFYVNYVVLCFLGKILFTYKLDFIMQWCHWKRN